MAIAKVRLNGVTQMDVTGKTVTAASMLSGTTALKNDGTDITGSISNMTLPSASSATSSGTSKATITPGSSAQYLNIPTGYNSAAQYYTIAAASGGASNVVTGTFKGTTANAAMDVTLSYTGNGYPIALIIFPKDGLYSSSLDNLVQRYVVVQFFMTKAQIASAPTYDSGSNENLGIVACTYKSNSSSATTHAYAGSRSASSYYDADSSNNNARVARIRSKTKMSVFIAGTSYGFAQNVEYTYYVIYSS